MRKIAVFTGNRSEYGLLQPVLKALSADSSFEVNLIVSGSHLSADFGETVNEIDDEGIKEIFKIDLGEAVNSTNVNVLLSFSSIIMKGSSLLVRIKPHIMLLAGDRYETFAMAITAFYKNIPIAHMFGGDVSQGGHLDDSVRHSITKIAHLHFTTNEDSKRRVLSLGEEGWRVFNVGSPIVDNILNREYASREEISKELNLDLEKPIVLFTQHPVTTESDLAYGQVKESLEALSDLGYQTVITYPCNDAGSEHIIRAIEEYLNRDNFRIRKSLGWRLYLGTLKIASAVVGNSSSGLLETPILKVPCVNVGSRQAGRLRAENVIDVGYNRDEIKKAIIKSLKDEEFLGRVRNCSNPYGNGGASKEIAKILKDISLNKILLQKKITY